MPKTVATLHSEIPMISNFNFIKNLRLEIRKMKKWQENRNYRRMKDENGAVIANIITVGDVNVEVSEKVFLAYSQADRRERYVMEEVEPVKKLSLDKLLKDGVPLEKLGVEPESSAEDRVLEREDLFLAERYKAILPVALAELDESDYDLIQALYFDEVSTREYARQNGVTQHAVIKRRDRILRDMKKFFEKFPI